MQPDGFCRVVCRVGSLSFGGGGCFLVSLSPAWTFRLMFFLLWISSCRFGLWLLVSSVSDDRSFVWGSFFLDQYNVFVFGSLLYFAFYLSKLPT